MLRNLQITVERLIWWVASSPITRIVQTVVENMAKVEKVCFLVVEVLDSCGGGGSMPGGVGDNVCMAIESKTLRAAGGR